MYSAFPRYELLTLSCSDADMFGGLTLSLVDTLNILIVFRVWPSLLSAATYLRNSLTFVLNTTPSVFEITIWVVGRLPSAHCFLTDAMQIC